MKYLAISLTFFIASCASAQSLKFSSAMIQPAPKEFVNISKDSVFVNNGGVVARKHLSDSVWIVSDRDKAMNSLLNILFFTNHYVPPVPVKKTENVRPRFEPTVNPQMK